MAQDFEKLNAALLDGWAVLLMTGSQVRNGYGITLLESIFRSTGKGSEAGE